MQTWPTGEPIPNPSNSFTDVVISANVTTVKKRHIDELRAFLEGMNGHYHIVDGAPTTGNPSIPVSWAEPITTTTIVRKPHIDELRAAMTALNLHTHQSKGLTSTSTAIPVGWAEQPITANSTLVRKPHMDELRAACNTLRSHTHTLCCECECTCTCTCTCTNVCGEQCCRQCMGACD